MSFDESVKRGVQFGFIPRHLEIADRPELNVFPLNILFAQAGERDGKPAYGTALYEPDLMSYRQDGEFCTMTYHNAYGGKSWVEVRYNSAMRNYHATKFVNDERIGEAIGQVWEMFFAHLTMLGLKNGERCEFQDLTETPKSGIL